MYVTCREDAGSGFSQSAEFHILLWMGAEQSYYLHPSASAKPGSGKEKLCASAQAEGRELLFG